MKLLLSRAANAVLSRKLLWVSTVLLFTVTYYAGLLLAAVIRFRELPNHFNLLNWPRNIGRIIEGTPSFADAWNIIGDEWVLDIGRMNYSYGHGVAEWAMTIITAKLVVIIGVGALVATALALVLQLRAEGALDLPGRHGVVTTIIGAALVGVGNATLHWAVACATPSWVASLAMLGMSPALALWLEPVGSFVTAGGFLFLLSALALLAQERTQGPSDHRSAYSPTSFDRGNPHHA